MLSRFAAKSLSTNSQSSMCSASGRRHRYRPLRVSRQVSIIPRVITYTSALAIASPMHASSAPEIRVSPSIESAKTRLRNGFWKSRSPARPTLSWTAGDSMGQKSSLLAAARSPNACSNSWRMLNVS